MPATDYYTFIQRNTYGWVHKEQLGTIDTYLKTEPPHDRAPVPQLFLGSGMTVFQIYIRLPCCKNWGRKWMFLYQTVTRKIY